MTHPRSGSAAPPRGGAAGGLAKPEPRRLLGAAVLMAALCSTGAAQAQLFPDNEARKAILELRAADEAQARRITDLATANRELVDQVQQLRRSLLELNSQIEALRGDIARQTGGNEQLAREVAELQRRQKDIAQGVEDRIRKIEPQKVTLDGKEFSVDAEEKRQYEEAFATIRAGNFDAAVVSLYAFMRRYPNSGYIDSARFWAGNAHYGKREYREAIASFRAFIAGAPDHARIPEAMLAVANTQVEMKDPKAARATLAELVKRYPDSEAAQAGRERLAVIR